MSDRKFVTITNCKFVLAMEGISGMKIVSILCDMVCSPGIHEPGCIRDSFWSSNHCCHFVGAVRIGWFVVDVIETMITVDGNVSKPATDLTLGSVASIVVSFGAILVERIGLVGLIATI